MPSTSQRRSTFPLIALAGMLALIGCGGKDSQAPSQPPSLVTPAPVQNTPVNGITTLRVDGGAQGSEHVLVLADSATTSVSTKTAYSIAATGVGAAGAISAPSSVRIPEPASASEVFGSQVVRDESFHIRLSAQSRSRLAPGFNAARSALAARRSSLPGPSRSLGILDPAIGDLVNVNVASRACDSVVARAARVVAIGTQSIVIADTLNPAGGFSNADYQRFATRFDTLVYPLEVLNFGAPADVDQNKKIVLLFTSAVNELTPRNSASYVAGFFFDRDLFPVLSTPDFQGCAGSNYGELFYLLAPDPTGLVNGNVRRTGFVDSVTTSVVAHEFQHLINSSRRLYVNKGATDFEVTWLNEGLSHIAEELLFYREANIEPRSNVDVTLIRSNPSIRSAYNADMSANTARYRLFLVEPSDNSPIRLDDSLATRGASWNLLRYLADRKAGSSGSDIATWQALVNSTKSGVANLRTVFGADVGGLLRDWLVSHYTDDLVVGIAREFTQPSWNFHNIYPALSGASNAYPLQIKTFSAGAGAGSLIGGSAAYYRFSVPANTTATINVTAPGPIDARVVRVR